MAAKSAQHPPGDIGAAGRMRPARPLRELDLDAITEGAREVVILHNGERYRLRVTANDKLILTK